MDSPPAKYENGVTAVGLDITKFAKFDGQDNLIAVKVDNSPGYKEEATGTAFEWNSKDFNPNFGGLNRDATLIVAGKIYQTLPLYENLKTTGIYVYRRTISTSRKTADLKVEAEVINETGDTLRSRCPPSWWTPRALCGRSLTATRRTWSPGRRKCSRARVRWRVRIWDAEDPYLYRVYSTLTVDGKVVDVCETTTGFRKTEFKGGAGTGGVYLNGRSSGLPAMPALGQRLGRAGRAYPDWMHDITLRLVRESHGNYMRWMHISPQRADVAPAIGGRGRSLPGRR